MKLRSFALLCAVSCSGATQAAPVADSGAAYVPGATWRTAAPAATGLWAERLATLARDVAAGRYGRVEGILIVRFGHLVHEQYVGWDATHAHTMQSVTKSVTALLYGIAAAQQGATAQLDRPLVDLFARYQPIANADARKAALTMRHLLSMRTSMDFWEQPYSDSPLDSLNRSRGDWVRYVLDRRMTGTPGTVWSYNSGAAILACGAIRELTGQPVEQFARQTLFDPTGVTGAAWVKSPFDALPHCGGGLYLKPADLARIGYLVLRRGRWGDRQVVPAEWIDAATQPYSSGPTLFFSSFGAQYGYYWWLFPSTRGGTGAGVIAASGSGGQWLFVVPSLDLVVVIVGTSANGLDLLYNGVLSAVAHR